MTNVTDFYEVIHSSHMGFMVMCDERVIGVYQTYEVAIHVCDALNNEVYHRKNAQTNT